MDTNNPTIYANLTAKPPASKSAIVAKLLTRTRGASVAEMQGATGWQPHSVRAHLSGLRKAGKTLTKEQRKDGGSAYRLSAPSSADEMLINDA